MDAGHAEADAGVPAAPARRQGRLPAQPAGPRHLRPGARTHITNAYIVWALTEGGTDGRRDARSWTPCVEQAKTSDDAVFPVAGRHSLLQPRPSRRGRWRCSRRWPSQQKDDGRLEAAQTSITGSGGRDLQIETTALAVLGWLKANPADVRRGDRRRRVKWIGQQRGGYGGFGSTQSTILALKALIAHAKANKRTPEAGELRLFVGETKVAELTFPAGVDRPLSLELPDAGESLATADDLECHPAGSAGARGAARRAAGRLAGAHPAAAARRPARLAGTDRLRRRGPHRPGPGAAGPPGRRRQLDGRRRAAAGRGRRDARPDRPVPGRGGRTPPTWSTPPRCST